MNIQLLDYRGQTWHLAGDDEGAEGVTLGKISNTVGNISDQKDKHQSRFQSPSLDIGELDPIEPTLTVQITTTPELTVETVTRRFLNGLDFFKPAKLIVTESRQPSLCLFVHLAKPVGLPEDTTAIDGTTMEVELTAKDGCWFGPQHSGTGIVAIENTGDIPLWPTVRWRGMAARFTEDRNGLIVLPPALGRSGLTYYTDPATGGLVTDNQGYPNHTAWATMRGVAWTRPVMPGDGTAVECHHCQVLWRNRYLSPWAQSGGDNF